MPASIRDSGPRSWPLGSEIYSKYDPSHLLMYSCLRISMPLRPILKKNLLIRSSQTGTKADLQEALRLCAAGKVKPIFETTDLDSLNAALDRVKAGKVEGKLVVDLRNGEPT